MTLARDHGRVTADLGRTAPSRIRYNGAVEAGGESIQTRTYHEAARHERAREWTCDGVEAARLQANETGRPWGSTGRTPLQAWEARRAVTPAERTAFHDLYRKHAEAERAARGWLLGIELQRSEQSAIDRVAISPALIDQGSLLVRRRRVALPIRKLFAAEVS